MGWQGLDTAARIFNEGAGRCESVKVRLGTATHGVARYGKARADLQRVAPSQEDATRCESIGMDGLGQAAMGEAEFGAVGHGLSFSVERLACRAFGGAPHQQHHSGEFKVATKQAAKGAVEEIEIVDIQRGRAEFHVIGTTPLICNAMSTDAMGVLLAPGRKKTQAEKDSTMKHNPYREFRNSVYQNEDPAAPTLIAVRAASFKNTMAGVTKDAQKVAKTEVLRWIRVHGWLTSVYGAPQIFLTYVRNSDAKRTPDVRTRAIFPRWCASFTVQYAMPMLSARSVGRLLSAAGEGIGIGDWRLEKGGNFGEFRLCDGSDSEFLEIKRTGDRAAQVAAMERPTPFNLQTEELLRHYEASEKRRNIELAERAANAANKAAKAAAKGAAK